MPEEIVCPFCKTVHPVPEEFDVDLTDCPCGAQYWLSYRDDLERDLEDEGIDLADPRCESQIVTAGEFSAAFIKPKK